MPYRIILVRLLLGCAVALNCYASAQTGRAIVTAERKKGNQDAVQRENVLVFAGGKRAPTSVWRPFTGEHAGMQLLILVDDSSASGLAVEMADLRNFVQALPATVEVGVAYMQNGSAAVAQNFTPNHSLAAKAIRVPLSARGIGSPFFTLSAVTRQWPSQARTDRREILMITDGVDRYSDQAYNPDNPYVTKAIQDAQRARIPVYTIYFRGVGRLDSDPTVISGGQNYLTQVSQETGGKCLYFGTGNPVSLTPLLNELSRILDNQYELAFQPTTKPRNGLMELKLKMETAGIKLVAPTYVPVSE